MNLLSSIPLILCTCDKYSFLWNNFFFLFNKYWPNHPSKVFGTQESLEFSYQDIKLLPTCNKSFSNRLIYTLKKINTEFVFLFVDDHFLESSVKVTILSEALKTMNNDKNIGCIKLYHYGFESSIYNEYFSLIKKQPYRVAIGPSLWRVSFLKKILRRGEDVWMIERYGNIRSNFLRFKILEISNSMNNPFPITFGGLMIKGKINRVLLDKIEKNENIVIQYIEPQNIELSRKQLFPTKKKSIIRHLYNILYNFYHMVKPL